MNAKQRRTTYRHLRRLMTGNVPVTIKPFYGRSPTREVVKIHVVYSWGTVGIVDPKLSDRAPYARCVAAHNIKPVPRCWRTGSA